MVHGVLLGGAWPVYTNFLASFLGTPDAVPSQYLAQTDRSEQFLKLGNSQQTIMSEPLLWDGDRSAWGVSSGSAFSANILSVSAAIALATLALW
jgi:hypothetical protein